MKRWEQERGLLRAELQSLRMLQRDDHRNVRVQLGHRDGLDHLWPLNE